jgi:hypothetical protein
MNIHRIHGSEAPGGTTGYEPKSLRNHGSVPPPPTDARAARTHISGPGQLFSQLQQLATQDPDKFKEVAQKISDQLSAAAEKSEGRASNLAEKLAERFEQAAESGDLSAFRPRGDRGVMGDHHHHHHHGHHGPFAGGNAVRSVLENALDLMHEALAAPSSAAPTAETVPGIGTAAPTEAPAATEASAPAEAPAPNPETAEPADNAAV